MDSTTRPRKWQDIFISQPVPSIRNIEKQLRASVLRDKERLRVLVGGNYRELLSTADEIVDLNLRSQTSEQQIASISSVCKPPDFSTTKVEHSNKARIAAQLRLLNQCIHSASSELRSRSVLLSTQLIVVARLLLKSFEESQTSSKAIGSFRQLVESHRRQLIRRIDAQLNHPSSSVKSLVEAICAHCLLRGASSTEALKHFRDLRLDALRHRFDREGHDSTQTCENIRYAIKSVRSFRTLMTRGVNDALNSLQKSPILENPSIRALENLNLDQIRSLIPSDVLTFTPYFKRVLLQKTDVDRATHKWMQEASDIVGQGLQKDLQDVHSVDKILSLRKDLLGIILPRLFSSHAHDTLLPRIREPLNRRLLELCRTQINVLLRIGHDIVSHADQPASDIDLWDTSFVEQSFDSNGSSFLGQVQSRQLGVKGDLNKDLRRLRKWTTSLRKLLEQMQELRTIRWQDMIEEPDSEEEDSASDILRSLSDADPLDFEAALKATIQEVISSFGSQLRTEGATVLSCERPPLQKVVFLLRAIREASAIISKAIAGVAVDASSLESKLHRALAAEVFDRLTAKLEKTESPQTAGLVAGDLPSPLTFSVLRELCTVMADIGGSDIWSSKAVQCVRNDARERILSPEAITKYTVNKFDMAYLAAALNLQALRQLSGTDDALTEAATSYWMRTRLLFGVLCNQ